MKKFLSLLLAIVMIVSIFPAQILSASAAEVTATLTFDNTSKRTVGTTSQQVWEENGVTVTNDKASSSSDVNTSYFNPIRLYKGSSLTIAYAGIITKIEATCSSSSYATVFQASAGDEATVSDTVVTITPTAESNTYTIAAFTAQTRLSSITVYATVSDVACEHSNTTGVDATAADCTNAGYTAGLYCNDCFTYIEGHEQIDALGHTETSDVTAPTCTEDGYTTYTCSVCGNVRKTDYTDATGHTLVDGVCYTCGAEHLNTEKATAIAVGDEVVFVCESASVEMNGFYSTSYAYGVAYTDAPMGVNVWTVEAGSADGTYAFVMDGAYLTWESGNSAKTSDKVTTNSSWTVTFDDSGNAIVTNAADATRNLRWNASSPRFAAYTSEQTAIQLYKVVCAHENKTTTTVDATCTVNGSTTVTCDDCGETISSTVIEAVGHNYVDDVCSVCGAEFEGEVDTPDTCEHTNTTTTTVDATCTTAGSVTVVCDACGETISTEEIAATGIHTEVVDAAVAATCTATGLTEGSHCSVCNETIVAQEVTDALGHTIESGTCSVCYVTDLVAYELVTTDTVRAGNYVIGAIRSGEYPAVYLATSCSGDWTVASSSINAVNDIVTNDLFADDVQVVTLTGDSTNGFKISYNNGTEDVYLGYTSATTNRTLAFSADYSSILWKVQEHGDGVCLTDGSYYIFQNSTGTTAIRGYYNHYDTAKGIFLFREVVENECTHEVETWTVDTAPTCTELGSQSGACIHCGETQTSAIPAKGHTLAYSKSAIICANGCDYSQAYTLSTIADAKAYTDTSLVYYVKGVVTYVSGSKVYIEDSTGGILVNFTSADAASGIALGDEILVWDCMTTYNGLIETTYTLATEYVKVSSGNDLPCQTVTIADLLADTTNEFLAERVVIENVTIGTINTSGNTALTDADGNSISIYKVSGLSENINENDTVTATVIVSTYNGYQLLVNPGTAAADVVETVSGEETVVTTVTIAEAQAGTVGTYYQVEGTVTYISGRNVYIQDKTGGIVVYLTANAATTQVGDKVKAYGALKIYNGLIELDAVDETNTEFYEILSNGNTVDAQSVTITDLIDDEVNFYYAEKISLERVYVSYYSYNGTYGNVTYTLIDGNGNTIQIYRMTVSGEDACVAGGSIVNVEAVVSKYVTDDTDGNGYQLLTTVDKITVTGTCAHETTELVNYSAPTYTTAGYTGDKMCTVCQNYTERGEAILALNCADSYGITLKDNICITFNLSQLATDDVVTATVAGKGVDVVVDENGNFFIELAAAQMMDEIVISINDVALATTYTIRGYADTILAGEYDDATKALVKAMLHYGAAAQTAFSYNAENLANADIEAFEVTVPADRESTVSYAGAADGVVFYGASLSHRNKLAVRFYFTGDNAASASYVIGDTTYTAVEGNGMYYIEVADILVQDLDEVITVVVSDSLTVTYSAMDYIVRMYNKYEDGTAVKALVQALYGYYEAAEAYLVKDAVTE